MLPASDNNKQKMYALPSVYQLLGCCNCDPKHLPGFEIKSDGIWVDLLPEDDRKFLHPNELAAIYAPFENHDLSKPVLLFPCTGQELKHFLEITGFYCGEDIDTSKASTLPANPLTFRTAVPTYFTLEQAAKIVRPERDGHPLPTQEAVKELLEAVFSDSNLMASCFIKASLLTFWVDIKPNPEEDNPDWPLNDCGIQQCFPDNRWNHLLIDVFLDKSSRNSGKTTGKIQLLLYPGEKTGRLHSPSLYLATENLGYVRCQLLKPSEVAESELVVRRSNLEHFIRNDEEAMRRLEAFCVATEVPEQNVESQLNPTSTKLNILDSAKQLVVLLKKKGLNDKEIAAKIDTTYPGISDAKLGQLFQRAEIETYYARRKRGQRLRGKAK